MTIAITATFTAESVEESLAYWMGQLGIPAAIRFAPYNQLFQQLHDAESLVSGNRDGINVHFVRLEDWWRLAGERAETVERNVHELTEAVSGNSRRFGTTHLVCLCPASPAAISDERFAGLSCNLEKSLVAALADASGVYVVSSSELNAVYPVADYYDPSADELGHVPYTPAFFAALGTMAARKIYALKTAPKKVIALDCDQTLWKGVCGEDGPAGVTVDLPHMALQEFMAAQHDAGMLLCLCSKNNEQDVWEVFRCQADMPLKRDQLVSWRINWQPKSENLKALAAELGLGLDSFIFVDDNPAECAEVEAGCPEVLTICLPSDADEIPKFLGHVWAFDHLRLTGEDRRRTALYQQDIRRERFHQESSSFEAFLASLGLVVKITPMRAGQLARVAQLTQRTNQFNFTTIRRTETGIQELLDETGAVVLTVEVEDRFGDYGLVGLMICRAAETLLEVDTFLLSCRVLGKGVEHRMLAHLGELSLADGCKGVDIKLSRTPKNGPAVDFITAVAGAHLHTDGDKYFCQLPAAYAAAVKLEPKSGNPSPIALAETSPANAISVDSAEGTASGASRLNWIATEMNEAGRIYRAIVENKRAKRPASLGTPAAPRDLLEQQLTHVWETVLGVEIVGIHDNFLELGGHSLTAVRLLSEVEKLTGKRLALVTLFQAPTIAELAPLVRQHETLAAGAVARFRSDPERAHEPFPLTDLQQAYVVGRSRGFDLASPLHLYFEFDFDHFDLDRAGTALRTLIARHPMLRAVVCDDGLQRVLSRVPEYQIDLIDLRNHSVEKAAAILAAERERLSHQCFDLTAWPWFEVRAVRLDECQFRLLISYDAVMLDAWSTYLLAREFATLFSEPGATLPALDVTFRDCVLAEIASRESESYLRAKQYWTGRLAKIPPSPALPLAKSPGAISQPRTVRLGVKLDRERWEQFRQHASQNGITPGMALIGAYAEIVAHWSQDQRFTLSLPIFNRPPLHSSINSVAGYFTSLSLLAVDLTRKSSFANHVRVLQQQLLNDLDHSAYNGIQVTRDLARVRGANGHASAPIVTTNIMLEEGFQFTLPGRVVFGLSQTPQVLLDQIVTTCDGALVVVWDALAELFPGNMLEEMFEAFSDLISRLANEEALWSAKGSPVRLPSIRTAHDTCAPSDEMLHTLFLKQLPVRHDEPAVITPSRTLGYGELHRRATFIAQHLRESGVKPNSLVAIVMEKGWEQIVAALGILYSGAAYLPIEAGLPAERLQHLLRHGEVKIALTQSRHAGRIAWPEDVEHVCVDETGELDGDFDAPIQAPEDLAYVIFTSGSTGLPKGVMTDHRGAVNTILDINRRYRVTAGDRVFALSSLGFDLSVYDVFGLLAAGGTIVMPAADDAFDSAHWSEMIVRHGVTIWNSVPALMSLFVDYAASHPEMAGNQLRLALLSGDWIPLPLPGQIHALAPEAEVISLGGATEASIWSILYPIQKIDPSWKSIPYGQAMVNQSFCVLDKALDPRPAWVPGELYIGGIGLAKGYWRNREKTEASFITHPCTGERMYRTGDLGRWLPDGNIEFLGREDFQVKIQGLRIELEEIETALLQHPGLSAAVVTARGERDGPRRLVAYIVSKDQAPAADKLRDFLTAKLPEYMVPSAFISLDALPLTENGKINRAALPEPNIVKPANTAVAPRNEVELKLAKIWEEVFGLRDIGVEDDFFNLGGHSLLGLQIVSRIGKTFDKKLPLSAIFQARNIAKLAAVLREAKGSSPWYSLIPIQPRISRAARAPA